MPVTSPVSKPYGKVRSDTALGILVCERNGNPPFAESTFIKRLNVLGAASGLQLFAFAPWTWDAANDSVKGWSWNPDKHRWEACRRQLPSVVYDRSWPETQEEKRRYRLAIQNIRAVKQLTFLNGFLPHKGKVYEVLSTDRTIAKTIPPTVRYQGPTSIAAWLRKCRGSVFLKPIAGSQGKRVIAICRVGNGKVNLTGRQGDNRPMAIHGLSEAEALHRLDRWIGDRAYLMQPLLELKGRNGEPFDLRCLMQKDQTGRWTLTGVAARLGSPDNVTSNLHGGGNAAPAKEVLTKLFGEQRGAELLQEVSSLSFLIVARLEQTLGRFAEIGLDFGVDCSGKLWFLEANSKPGRTSMRSAGQEAVLAAALQPLSYARSILLRPLGRVIHEFDHL
ncbi:YheC/YheD family endospore coat-associated protein [Cohnella mopanensis]|uniref:YheC/YheD family endospore coat-associated protein n=1 Tax=Cohnella mopanensis TaxID=2911966 RepID=UPI001EF7CAF1|nr:YheC/YheD family protein [Cohnella mopanensis]